MKKILGRRSEAFKPVRLYLDDIEDIIRIIKEKSENVTIQVEDNLLENLEEFSSIRKEIFHNMEIQSTKPSLYLSMNPWGIRLSISEDTPESRGIFEKIKSILKEHKRPFSWFFYNFLLIITCLVFPIVGLILSIQSKILLLSLLFAILTIIFVYLSFNAYNNSLKRHTNIIPKYRVDCPSFFKRNRDMIFTSVIIAIISLIIGAIMGNLMPSFFPKK